jgi:hypothetical protein
MRQSTRATVVMLIALAALISMAAAAFAQSRSRVDPSARDILAYRLSRAGFRGAEAVMLAMDTVPSRGPEMPRADVAIVTVLNMAFAYNEPWRDTTFHDTVRSIDTGHPDLAAAIRSAGISTRDYVLTHMTLLLAYPIAAQRRQGRSFSVTDVAPENVAWLEANWADVERFMNELRQRIAAARSTGR